MAEPSTEPTVQELLQQMKERDARHEAQMEEMYQAIRGVVMPAPVQPVATDLPSLTGAIGPQSRSRFSALSAQPATNAFASSSKAPELPTVRPGVGSRWRKQMDEVYLADPEGARREFNEFMERLDTAIGPINPYTQALRHNMLTYHNDIMERQFPEVHKELYWTTDTIQNYAEQTIIWRIKSARNPDGGPIQARTAISWLNHHTYNICMYTRDPATGDRSGLIVLRSGLYDKMEQSVKWACLEFDLPRHLKKQVHLGQVELQLMMEQVLHSSRRYGRHSAIQTLMAMTLAFYGALRSGSMQANHSEYAEREMASAQVPPSLWLTLLQYIKLYDCKVEVTRPGVFSTVIDIKNWKGYSGVIGMEQTLTIGPVSKAHNVNFDFSWYFALDLLHRGALEGINDIDELVVYNKRYLIIKEDYKKYPMFLKRGPRGHSLIEGTPAGKNAISGMFRHAGARAGIKGANVHSVRRGSADAYATSLGKDRALILLNHGSKDTEVFDQRYTTGLRHAPLVEIRLGDFAGTLGPIERAMWENKKMSGPGLDVIIRRSMATREPQVRNPNRKLTDEEEEEVSNDRHVQPVWVETKNAWDELLELFPEVKKTKYYIGCKTLVKTITSSPTSASKHVVDARVARFNDCNSLLIKRRGIVIRRLRTGESDSEDEATIEDREAAKVEMEKPSAVYDEVKELFQKEVSDYLKTKATVACGVVITEDEAREMNLPESIRTQMAAPLEAIEEEEEEDDEEQVVDHQTPLPGRGIPKSSIPIGSSNFTSLNSAMGTIPNQPALEATIENEQSGNVTLQDEEEPDAIGIPCDLMRTLYMRYVYGPLGRGPESLICDECPAYHSRMKEHPDGIFRFPSISAKERHKREQHSAWSAIELEMQTPDPDVYICHKCGTQLSTGVSALKHCRKFCPHKDEFLPIWKEFRSLRSTSGRSIENTQEKDKRRDKKWVGKQVTIKKKHLLEARSMRKDFASDPELFEKVTTGRGQTFSTHDTGGMSMGQLQTGILELSDIALSQVPRGNVPEDWSASTVGLPHNFVRTAIDDTVDRLAGISNGSLSDYTPWSDSENGEEVTAEELEAYDSAESIHDDWSDEEEE